MTLRTNAQIKGLILKTGLVLGAVFFSFTPLSAAQAPKYKPPRPLADIDAERADKSTGVYRYNPKGKVDPFKPFILKDERQGFSSADRGKRGDKEAWISEQQKLLDKLVPITTRLQEFALSQLTLTAVIKDKDNVWAMVTDPDGRGYVIHKGDYIGDERGIVDQILVKDEKTPFGIQTVRKIVIKEPFFNQERKLDWKFKGIEMPFSKNYR